MSGTNFTLPPGAVDSRPANASHAGLMPRWHAPDATHASFAVEQVGSHSDIYPSLATALVAGALSAADYAALRPIISPPRARAASSVVRAIPTGTPTAVIFDTAGLRYNVQGAGPAVMWASGTPTRLTAQLAGNYRFSGGLQFASVAGGTFREVYIRHSNTLVLARARVAATTGLYVFALSSPYIFAAGDYIELYASHDAGVNINVGGAFDADIYLEMQWTTA